MNLNTHIDDRAIITIRDKNYPVLIAGNGIPCLSIGIGTHGQRTLSKRFKKKFKVYSTDLYWDGRYKIDDISLLDTHYILDDIAELAHALKLEKFVIFGFSAFGIIALEFAKKYPSMIMGIIMSGTPPNSNHQVAQRNDEYFQQHANQARKELDKYRNTLIQELELKESDLSARIIKSYILQSTRYWYIADFDCTEVWQDIVVGETFLHLFSIILPAVDVTKNLESISCPIFLAAGDFDYDCYPLSWREISNLPPHMTISRFTQSGHWPQYEEQQLFDERIETWVKENF